MTIIIKAQPEDFKVEEVAQLPLVKKGDFAVYRLEKRGWNTMDALREISKNSKIPSKFFSYGGKKTGMHIRLSSSQLKDRGLKILSSKLFLHTTPACSAYASFSEFYPNPIARECESAVQIFQTALRTQ